MTTRRTFLAAAGAAALPLPGFAQATPVLRGADLRGDAAILRQAYETLHPGLLRYATPGETQARFDALEQAFSRDQSLAEAYLRLSQFLATIRCGHTYANFFNQRRAVREALFERADKPPFCFIWLEGRMIVTRNLSGDPRLAPGAEIVRLNGMAPARVLRTLMAYARADGGNDAKRAAFLSVSGLNRLEAFDVFYPLVYPMADGVYRLRVRAPGGRSQSVEAAAITPAQRSEAFAAPASSGDAPLWTLSFPAPRCALLTMPNWVTYNTSWNWRDFLDDAFAQIADRRASGLIVDLRDNEGGEDCGDEIIARLIDRDLVSNAYERRVRYRKTPDALNPYLETWDNSFRDWGDAAEPLDDRFFRLRREGDDAGKRITPKGPRFSGAVIVLTSAQNSSATFQFAKLVQENGLGRLLGGATGGNRRGINGGAFFFLRLPGSGLECDLPLIGTFPTTPQPDAGLLPDIAVAPTAQALAAGRDAQLEAALALIARG
ncbi:MAG: peptidase S41 [Alphaproteobacteria bacterium]|nr:peptidase S41 [Alphaproteobacteria bacterium]